MNERQRRLRLRTLEQIRKWGRGHSGRALSSLDLMEALYFGEENGRSIFKHNPLIPQWDERDYFVLSKKEAFPALLAVLEENGYTLPDLLPEQPSRRLPGVDVSISRSGFGIGVAVGLAKAIQVNRSAQHVFCLAGDYELDHGETWEAISAAAEHKLERLCLILDENDPRDVLWQERFESFGWKVIKLRDAHDHDDIVYGYMKARLTLRKPTCIWAPTRKSSGVPFAEFKPEYDDTVFSDSEYEEIRHLLL